MSPEVIRRLAQLRQEFYTLFSKAMEEPVKIVNRNSYASNLSMASWIDNQARFNYIYIYAHTAPDELVPDRPLTLRLSVNKGGDFMAPTWQKRGSQELNRSWHFELILLPEEILDFLPWIVHLIKSYNQGADLLIPEPPYPLVHQLAKGMGLQNAQTYDASNRLAQPLYPVARKEECLSAFPKQQYR